MKKRELCENIVSKLSDREVVELVKDIFLCDKHIFFRIVATLLLLSRLVDDESGRTEEELAIMLTRSEG